MLRHKHIIFVNDKKYEDRRIESSHKEKHLLNRVFHKFMRYMIKAIGTEVSYPKFRKENDYRNKQTTTDARQ